MQRLLNSLVKARGFCTKLDKIVASVLFKRLPVVIPKIDPVVYAFQEFSDSSLPMVTSLFAMIAPFLWWRHLLFCYHSDSSLLMVTSLFAMTSSLLMVAFISSFGNVPFLVTLSQ
uniref:Uncharacterized protein n=1 Tax=Fagus sylvatica TaxID=28930 RepID=A0A2N9JBL6_FAGSY